MTVRTPIPTSRAAALLVACACILISPAIARADSLFAVSGRGWGHGIGMTQYGAMGYANQGWGYERILGWYFQGTSIATRPELTVKVDLSAAKGARASWLIAAASSSATLTVSDLANGAHKVDVTGGAAVWITFSGGGTTLRSDRYDATTKTHAFGSIIATFPGSAVADTGPLKDSMVRLLGTSGPFADSGVAWRGQIRFTPHSAHPTAGHAIDYVPMEQYLRGVVPRESPSSWPVEALRAQAVAARSYAYDVVSSGDVLWCTTRSQVYNGARHGTATHESTKTDAAVADTASEFVVYGSKVVQTFFSSSSGGRTANSKDVWFSGRADDESPVYYTSVADADDVAGNPNYRWTLADMTGSTMAGKLRGYDRGSDGSDPLEYSVASPATVTSVTLEPGASGFIRFVTLKWSNGRSYTIPGTTFQFALGLKSSAFSVRLKNPPALATSMSLASRDSSVQASVPFVLSGALAPARVAQVTIQHRFPGSSTWVTFRTLTTGADGTFTCTTATGALGTSEYRALHVATTGWLASTSTVVKVLVVAKPVLSPPVWKRYDQGASCVRYAGSWSTSSLPGLSGGTHAFSHATSATVTFTFTGTRVRWIGKRAANYGKAWVSVDGAKAVLVDLYYAKTLNQRRLFESAVLAAGTHTLRIRVAGTKNAKATYHYVDADAFEALEPAK